MASHGIDGLLVSQPENRRYLSGFDGSAGYLLISTDRAILATDFRYTEQATAQAPEFEVRQITGTVSTWLPELATGLNSARLGVEAEYMTMVQHQQLAKAMEECTAGPTLVAVEGLVEKLRMVKEPVEIDLISRAAQISDAAFDRVAGQIQPGMTEEEVAWQLEKAMRELGSQAVPFDVIVAAGPNAALPHHKPSERPIQTGEPVVIDMGARMGGYCSDLTRTVCLGAPSDTFKKVYGVVLEAQLAAIDGIGAGMTGQEADALAREIIQKAGHGEAFGHSLGHGVGLAPHEEPRLGPNAVNRLGEDMVFSIEPGIYLSGWGGVRIEDLAVMKNGRVRLLSAASKMDLGGG